MMIDLLPGNWNYILPELAVVALILVLVFFDLFKFTNTKFTGLFTASVTSLILVYIVSSTANAADVFANGNYHLLRFDMLGKLFKILIYISTIIVLFFSIFSNEILAEDKKNTEYYILVCGMLLGMSVMTSSYDLIVIYVGFELLSLSSYVLAGFLKNSNRSSESALKYLVYGAASSGIMLFGISLFYGVAGTTNLHSLGELLAAGQVSTYTLVIIITFILAGIGFKISVAPFHFWTPDVYEGAPMMITAYLSVASKAAGFMLLIRFLSGAFLKELVNNFWVMYNVLDWQTIIFGLAIITMTIGNFAALWQKNIKRLLAYSSVAHAGYILLGIGALNNDGITAVIFYFIVYMFMNLGAFVVLMLLTNNKGNENISSLDGMGYTSPFLAVLFVIFLVSLAGLPPTGGFTGKLYIFVALFSSKLYTYALIALLNTVVSLYYYARIIKHLFLKDSNKSTETIQTPLSAKVMLLVLTIPIFLLGLYFSPLLNYISHTVKQLTF